MDVEHFEKQEDFELFAENEQAFEVFTACATQWRYAGMSGQALGLDYPALQSVMQMLEVDNQSAVFQQVRLIESGALSVMNQKQ